LQFAELMRGRMGVESAAGRGSLFWFTVHTRTRARTHSHTLARTRTRVRARARTHAPLSLRACDAESRRRVTWRIDTRGGHVAVHPCDGLPSDEWRWRVTRPLDAAYLV
jgi:hypothetical protein